MRKLTIAAIAALTTMSVAACGSTGITTTVTRTTPKAAAAAETTTTSSTSSINLAAMETCLKGEGVAGHWKSDWASYWSVAQNDPTSADPSKVNSDLTQLGSIMSQLAQADNNAADVARITAEQQGLGDIKTAVLDLQSGDVQGFVSEAEQGSSAISGFGTALLAACKSPS